MSHTTLLTHAVTLRTYLPSLNPNWGDLILIKHPHQLQEADPVYELMIVDSFFPSNPTDLLILPPEDWILFEKIIISDTTAGWTGGLARAARRVPHDRKVDAGATITLRPSNLTICNTLFGGRCPYERCERGLVVVGEATIADLSLGRSSALVPMTLCPFCMGNELLRLHEQLVEAVQAAPEPESATQELLRDAAIRAHRRNVNAERLMAGYAALPDDPGLYGLGSQTGEEIVPAVVTEYMYRAMSAAQTPPASPPREPFIEPARIPAGQARTAIRGRRGAPYSRGHAQFRRLGHDRTHGASPTSEVNMDETAVPEATLRIQDYHDTFPPRPHTMRVGDGTTITAAVEITAAGDAALQAALMRAFEEDTIERPPVLPQRPRATYGNAICTAPFSWYKLVQERVLDDVCAICLERFDSEPALAITALPCSHFFHEECVRGRTREQTAVTCPYRCVGSVQL